MVTPEHVMEADKELSDFIETINNINDLETKLFILLNAWVDSGKSQVESFADWLEESGIEL